VLAVLVHEVSILRKDMSRMEDHSCHVSQGMSCCGEKKSLHQVFSDPYMAAISSHTKDTLGLD